MLDADDSGRRHARVRYGGIFQIDRADPFTTGLDQILGAIAYLQDAVRIDGCDIAGGKPPIAQRRGSAFVIAADDPLTAHHQFSLRGAVSRQCRAVLADDLDVDAEDGLAAIGTRRLALRRPPLQLLLAQAAARCGGGAFRHSPALPPFHPEKLIEFGDHGEPPPPSPPYNSP